MEPLSQTPYVLLLSVPGINVVSAAEFAGEMGPIKHYPQATKRLPGQSQRLYPIAAPERRGSDHPQRTVGSHALNHDLRRAAILMIAFDNPDQVCNEHFGVLVAGWRARTRMPRYPSPRWQPLRRIAFHMVSGQMTLLSVIRALKFVA